MKRLALLILLCPFTALNAAGDGVKVTAETVFSIGQFPVTNSMVTSWIVSLLLVIFHQTTSRSHHSWYQAKGQLEFWSL